jgi:hypothetical protein
MRLHLEAIDYPTDDYQPEFETIEGKTFEGSRVLVDIRQFGNCRFVDCTFVYSGGPFGFSECELEGQCILSPTGSAHRMRQLLEPFRELSLRNLPRT